MPKTRKKIQHINSHLVKLGKNLQALRKRRGFTQKELGEKIGMTRESISSYESGRAHFMVSTLMEMASALKVRVNEILGQEHQTAEFAISRRWAKRMDIIESLPDSVKKHILRALDDIIKANTRLSIFED